jgi:hypothetical protein
MSKVDILRLLRSARLALLVYVVLPVRILISVLFGTVFGVFLLSLFAYLIIPHVSNFTPFSADQLLLWVNDLPTDSKTSVITSVLVILGFLVAFHSASINWKAEAKAQLNNRISDEIEIFYNEVSRLTTKVEIYVRSLVKAAELIQKEPNSDEAIFHVKYVLNGASEFMKCRDRLSSMSIEVHGIIGRHNLALSTFRGAIQSLEDCADAFTDITNHMWVHVPIVSLESPQITLDFTNQLNLKDCSDYIDSYKRNFNSINFTVGQVRGLLLSSFIEFNFFSYVALLNKSKLLSKFVAEKSERKRD